MTATVVMLGKEESKGCKVNWFVSTSEDMGNKKASPNPRQAQLVLLRRARRGCRKSTATSAQQRRTEAKPKEAERATMTCVSGTSKLVEGKSRVCIHKEWVAVEVFFFLSSTELSSRAVPPRMQSSCRRGEWTRRKRAVAECLAQRTLIKNERQTQKETAKTNATGAKEGFWRCRCNSSREEEEKEKGTGGTIQESEDRPRIRGCWAPTLSG